MALSLFQRLWARLTGQNRQPSAQESPCSPSPADTPSNPEPVRRPPRPPRAKASGGAQKPAPGPRQDASAARHPGAARPVRDNRKARPASDEAGEASAVQQPLANKKPIGDWQPPAPVPGEEGLFQNFALDRRILRAVLEDLHFTHCTPIQAQALPLILEGRDLAGKAQTGTGKTAVFLIQLIQRFLQNGGGRSLNQPFALVLAPTRELALQIAEDAEALSAYTPLRTVAVYGGIDYERQRRLVQSGCDLIVATPGRLIDYLRQRAIDLSAIQMLVIDEADRMLDMGFIPDVKRIIGQTPPPQDRQTMLFSATLSHDIMALAARWMRPEPSVVEIEPEHIVADGIIETTYACTAKEKLPILLWTLAHEDCSRVLIFRNRRRDVEELHELLLRAGVPCEMLSGDVDQKKRLRILEQFKEGRTKVIVATDVAGRGIHVDGVTHVFNFDFPYEAEDYVHRIGRTARAGHQGRAINFADEDCAFVVPDIEKFINRPLPITSPTDEMLVMPDLAPRHAGPPEAAGHHGGGARHGGGSRPSSHAGGGHGFSRASRHR